MKAGFIGLGSMGAPIARRLARCGFTVTGCDISPEMLAAFDEPGTAQNPDPIATAEASEHLGICVRTDAQLEQLAGDGRLFAALGQGGLVFLHSTVAPELAQRLAQTARAHGVGFIDVGVSGGGPAAIEGKLSLFVGCDPADLERGRPWLEAIGKVSHLGPVGRGQQGKLLNNLISIANYGMSAAIVDIALDMGFERDQFIAALNAGSAQSFALGVGPRFVLPREGAGAPGSFLGLHDLLRKDVDHCRELPVHEGAALAALLASCDTMLARIRRAASEAEGNADVRDPQTVIDSYFAAVRARDIDAFVDLFAEDADYTLPNAMRFEGRDAIRAVQGQVFASGAPVPSPGMRYVGPDGIAVEISVQLPDAPSRNTVNVYRFDDSGRIRSLAVTMRAPA